MKYAFDTNVFVDAFRSEAAAAELDRFLERAMPFTHLSAVVIQELRAGADTAERARRLERAVFRPFERRNRVFRPSVKAFKESGRLLAELAARRGSDFVRANRSLPNDSLLAASCREQGITLISGDADFDEFRPSLGKWKVVRPWP